MTTIEQSYRETIGRLIVLAGATFLVGTNAFVIAGLLPRIAGSLHATEGAVSYTVTAYALVVALAAPAIAVLLPRTRPRVLMAAGALLFAAGAAITALATGVEWFTVGRVVAAFGGAALVPTATAVAAQLGPAERRGRSLAIVGAGFTLATALGAPLGTALGSVVGWRTPLWILAACGLVWAAPLLALFRLPARGGSATLRERFAPLADARVVLTLGAVVLTVAAFNIVYIFSAAVSAPATDGSGAQLATLLLVYGAAGVVGNAIAGGLTDRLGSRAAAVSALAVQLVCLVAIAPLESSYIGLLVAFAAWGAAAFAITIPIQHRLVSLAPESAGFTMSWFSTAMYLGIAIAPPLGNVADAVGGAVLIPIAGAVATAAAVLMFLSGYRRRPARTLADAGQQTA
ncbi:MFS transporter [Microbacterium kyungheense]|uniref:Putative MFS family arabinose efflux permease n=1 Tax=Microbacterium kyungheense TaxID=1263636 RepID=A0A543EDV0_9MICO|nr:MFS transporter [Microbacterium kyungheense]TQM19778.1 putative MFS family arabinose efflux permease [Microbacterium kyungheense]